MPQKFKRFSVILVADKMPSEMDHFDKGFLGIVEGTYTQLYGGGDTDNYSLYMLDKAGKKIINQVAWYHEYQLTLVKRPSLTSVTLVDEWLARHDRD